jgi:hypothetical protein
MKLCRPTLKISFQIIFLSLLTVSSVQASEPSYNGKPLSEWLLELKLKHMAHHWEAIQAQTQQPEDAIQQIGTNAIPTLLNILGATERNKWWVLEKLKSREFRKLFHDQDTNLNDLQDVAVNGFGILGTNAVSAIPQINKLFRDWETCSPAAQALAELGPEGFAALTNGLSSKNDDIRGVTIWVIGEKAPVDSNTVARLMIGCLSDPQNRGDAARYLGGKDPVLAIPALLPLLEKDTNHDVVVAAARALSSYGAAAEIAIPKLLSLYTNGWDIRLMWAIKGIDIEAAAKAETLLVNSGPLNGARFGYTTTLLPNGQELIAGGYIHTEFPTVKNRSLASAELLDPTTGKWTETGKMNTARDGHAAILLRNGKVLLVGGRDDKGRGLTSAELYDPATAKWIETVSANSTHVNDSPVLQHDGKVWIKGDWNGRQFNGDELYNPVTEKWTVVTNK